MRLRLRRTSDWLRDRLWFWPVLAGVAGVGGAEGLVRLDRSLDRAGERLFPVFSGDADAARSVLTTIATASMTVLGVTLSITLAVLALTLQGYSPRVIRRFTRDRVIQAVVAGLTGTFAFALVALRLVREDSVPGVTVSVAVALAFGAVGLLIAFFHHLASEIRVERVLEALWRETAAAIPRLLTEGPDGPLLEVPAGTPSAEARAARVGRVRWVDEARLAGWARRAGSTVVVVLGPGDLVAEGEVVLRAFGPPAPDDDGLQALVGAVRIGPERTLAQDVGFGLRQIVDIALRALSPSLNDPTTAAEAVGRLADLLRRLARRRLGPRVTDAGEGAVIVRAPDWDDLVGLAFDEIAAQAEAQADAAISLALLKALERVLEATDDDPRRVDALRRRARRIRDGARRAIAEPSDLSPVEMAARRLV